ncbi:hypothetical protein, partial [Salmonella sp. s55004]|uniref:hypothetical protein n=1 Tax=Salmonella sp. s55004 TaxID=3159675 RepID=UPI00397FE5A7
SGEFQYFNSIYQFPAVTYIIVTLMEGHDSFHSSIYIKMQQQQMVNATKYFIQSKLLSGNWLWPCNYIFHHLFAGLVLKSQCAMLTALCVCSRRTITKLSIVISIFHTAHYHKRSH